MDQQTLPDSSATLKSVWSMAMSTLMFECEQFICTFTHLQKSRMLIPTLVSESILEWINWYVVGQKLLIFKFTSHTPLYAWFIVKFVVCVTAQMKRHCNVCLGPWLISHKSYILLP